MYVKPPTMKEINKIKKPWRGVSLFAGAGGSSTGHKWAGIDILVANEFIDHARACYELNHPECMVIPSDIRRIDPQKVLNYMGLREGELDLLDGSPPCFTKGTQILTDRGWKSIEEITVGTMVFTHKLRWRPVTATNCRSYFDQLYTIIGRGDWRFLGDKFITEKHPIYVRRQTGYQTKQYGEPEWVRVRDLQAGDLVSVPYVLTPVRSTPSEDLLALAYTHGIRAHVDLHEQEWASDTVQTYCTSPALASSFLRGIHFVKSKRAFDVCMDFDPVLGAALDIPTIVQLIACASGKIPNMQGTVCTELIAPVMSSDGFLWTPIETIMREQASPQTNVYNIAVQDDESYIAQNIVTHNCKAFSTAGKIEKNWGREVKYSGSVTQQVEDLFGHYCRFLNALKPKVFTAENVSGLIRGASKGYFLETMKDFEDIGYNVRAVVMNAAWLGVPQSRERIIFMGVRKDIDIPVPSVQPLPTICNLADALPHIARYKGITAGYNMYKSALNNPMRTIAASDYDAHESARMSAAGFIETQEGEVRRLTIEELHVLSGMPSDYQILGPYEKAWERLGRICVPQMTYAASSAFVKHVLEPYAKKRGKKPGQIFR